MYIYIHTYIYLFFYPSYIYIYIQKKIYWIYPASQIAGATTGSGHKKRWGISWDPNLNKRYGNHG